MPIDAAPQPLSDELKAKVSSALVAIDAARQALDAVRQALASIAGTTTARAEGTTTDGVQTGNN